MRAMAPGVGPRNGTDFATYGDGQGFGSPLHGPPVHGVHVAHGQQGAHAPCPTYGAPPAHLFDIELRMSSPDVRLGVDVVLVSSSERTRGGIAPARHGIIVERVNEGGVVDAWNRRNCEPNRVRPGDHIIRANGVNGDIMALAQELRSGRDLFISIERPNADQAHQWKDAQGRSVGIPGAGQAGPGQSGPGQTGLAAGVGHGGPGYSQAGACPPGGPCNGACGGGAFGQGLNAPRDGLGHGFNTALPRSGSYPNGPCSPGPNGGGVGNSLGGRGDAAAQPESTAGQYTFKVTLHKPEGARLGVDVLPSKVTGIGGFGGLTVKRISPGGVVEAWNLANRESYQVKAGDNIVQVNGVMSEFAQMMEELRMQKDLRIVVLRRPGAQTGPPAPPAMPALADTAFNTPGPPSRDARGPGPGALPSSGLAQALAGAGSVPNNAGNMGGPDSDRELMRFDVELEKAPGTRMGIDVMLVTGNGLYGLVVERVAEGGAVDLWNKRSRTPYRVRLGDCIVQVNGIGNWDNLAKMAEEFTRDCRHVRFTVQRLQLGAGVAQRIGAAGRPGGLPGAVALPKAVPNQTSMQGPQGLYNQQGQQWPQGPWPHQTGPALSRPQPKMGGACPQTRLAGMHGLPDPASVFTEGPNSAQGPSAARIPVTSLGSWAGDQNQQSSSFGWPAKVLPGGLPQNVPFGPSSQSALASGKPGERSTPQPAVHPGPNEASDGVMLALQGSSGPPGLAALLPDSPGFGHSEGLQMDPKQDTPISASDTPSLTLEAEASAAAVAHATAVAALDVLETDGEESASDTNAPNPYADTPASLAEARAPQCHGWTSELPHPAHFIQQDDALANLRNATRGGGDASGTGMLASLADGSVVASTEQLRRGRGATPPATIGAGRATATAPIGAGRATASPAAAHTPAHAPKLPGEPGKPAMPGDSEDRLLQTRPDLEAEDPAALQDAGIPDSSEPTEVAAPPPAGMLVQALQLSDDELTLLLRTAFDRRPWLRAPVVEALGVQRSNVIS